jgi:hypothetical protein
MRDRDVPALQALGYVMEALAAVYNDLETFELPPMGERH